MSDLLLEVLLKTISQNPEDQKRALDFLGEAVTRDFSTFVKELSVILRTEQCDGVARKAAGIQLKNVLCSKEDEVRHQYLQRWLSMPADVRVLVKQQVVQTLGTEPFRPSIAAQCVAAIACAELPSEMWPDVISILMNNVTSPGSSEMLKESSLEALGYICQDIDAGVLERQANAILTAIVHGMRKEEPSTHVRLAATNALQNSLEFTKSNFSNEPERHIIMQVVCEATQSGDMHVKVAALQCLVRIMSLYYQFMEQYMGTALFPITVQAMKTDETEVALQGIEFWSNVCEEEITLGVEAEEARENNRVPEQTSRHYAKGAVSHLCPLLLETLAKQDESDDDDDWTPSKAAGVCLMLLAQCVGDAIVDSVMHFFTHFGSNDWKYKEAAIMAFGSILDGPDPAKLMNLVQEAMPVLIQSMSDRHVVVRDTTAWTIGRVLEVCPEIMNKDGVLVTLLPALSHALNTEPRVAANVCWALVALVKAAYENAVSQGTDSTGQPDTYILSQCFEPMISELIKTTDRPDGNQAHLRMAAYETLMELIKNSPKDCYPVVQKTTVAILHKLEQLLNMESTAITSNDKSQVMDLLSLLCATLQSVLRKMQPEDAPVIGTHIMNGLLQIMARYTTKGGSVMEEALLAISVLVEVLGQNFAGYMPSLNEYLLRGLSNYDEPQVCSAAVGVVTDLCRSLETGIATYLDDIMSTLIQSLQSPKLNRDVKVTILAGFGDVALAIGSHFERYIQVVTNMLSEAAASAVVTNPEDYDQVDYVDKLRESCIGAYTGMLQGMRPASEENVNPDELARAKQSIGRYVEPMCSMIARCCELHPCPPSDGLIAAVAGLIGDLVNLYGNDVLGMLNNDKVNGILTKGRRSKVNKTRSIANWASKEIRKVSNANNVATVY